MVSNYNLNNHMADTDQCMCMFQYDQMSMVHSHYGSFACCQLKLFHDRATLLLPKTNASTFDMLSSIV